MVKPMLGPAEERQNDVYVDSQAIDEVPVFCPPNWSLDEVRRAIPPHLFTRSTRLGVGYFLRDIVMALSAGIIASYIDYFFDMLGTSRLANGHLDILRWAAWSMYWSTQSLILMGLWVIGHECGHGALSDNALVCDVVGFLAHTVVWTPYFTWKRSHHIHHIHHATMEKDDTYVPRTRSELSLPTMGNMLDDILGDAPLYNLFTLVSRQLFAYPIYLFLHATGHWLHWQWTEKRSNPWQFLTWTQWRDVVLSDLGIAAMAYAVWRSTETWGGVAVLKLYGIPWLLVSHWFVTLTYLQHTDSTIPRYRHAQWTFTRGAAATIDRNFLGWCGRFFLHGAAHFHVVHHFFPKLPFYHAEDATVHLKAFMGHHYRRSDEPVLKALWDTWNNCVFVEDNEDILFFRDQRGKSLMEAASLSSPISP